MANCPSCFVRLPLSGEPNCDCEPPTMRQAGRNGDYSHPGPNQVLVDPQPNERAREGQE